eukprot:478322_1
MFTTITAFIAQVATIILRLLRVAFGKNHPLLECLHKTEYVFPSAMHSDLTELITHHFWYLIKGLFIGNREKLIDEIKQNFWILLNKDAHDTKSGNLIISHSCRTIFYCVIKYLLSLKQNKKLKICCVSLQFGSFYRLFKALELSENCTIEFYEIGLNPKDWTIDESQINEEEIRSCDLILCQHFFGVPFEQNVLFQLGHKFNVLILEDLVQSGSLFGKYRGHKFSDICLWSGGADKTPACFGAGFGYFRDTQHGNALYQHCNTIMSSSQYKIESFKDRLLSLLKQSIYLIWTKNNFYLAPVMV